MNHVLHVPNNLAPANMTEKFLAAVADHEDPALVPAAAGT